MSGPVYNSVRFFFATLYPAYSSFKAVKTKNVREYVKWMMYWIIFALFTSLETLLDPFVYFWLPFYTEFKIVFLLYLVAPATRGSGVIYRRWVHPLLCDKEEEIDAVLGRVQAQGYNTALNWINRGVRWVIDTTMNTAIKGGGGIVHQLKKSYSLAELRDSRETSQQRFMDMNDEGTPYSSPQQRRRFIESQESLQGSPMNQRHRFQSNNL